MSPPREVPGQGGRSEALEDSVPVGTVNPTATGEVEADLVKLVLYNMVVLVLGEHLEVLPHLTLPSFSTEEDDDDDDE